MIAVTICRNATAGGGHSLGWCMLLCPEVVTVKYVDQLYNVGKLNIQGYCG